MYPAKQSDCHIDGVGCASPEYSASFGTDITIQPKSFIRGPRSGIINTVGTKKEVWGADDNTQYRDVNTSANTWVTGLSDAQNYNIRLKNTAATSFFRFAA